MVKNAVAEMRRYYSRKVVDVLIKVTRQSLDCLRKRFHRGDLQGTLAFPFFYQEKPIKLNYLPESRFRRHAKTGASISAERNINDSQRDHQTDLG